MDLFTKEVKKLDRNLVVKREKSPMIELLSLAPNKVDVELSEYIGLLPLDADSIVENAPMAKSDRLLTFWSCAEHKFPTISALAHWVLSIPCSSSPVERVFKFSKKQGSNERSQLSSSTIASLVMHISIDKFLEYKKTHPDAPYFNK